MLTPEPMEIGLVFWAEQDAESTLGQVNSLGIHAGQLGVPPGISCDAALDDWALGLNKWHVAVTSAVCSYSGEDYSNLQAIHRTVGFTQQRAERGPDCENKGSLSIRHRAWHSRAFMPPGFYSERQEGSAISGASRFDEVPLRHLQRM